jgi:hypothetical protein
MYILLRRAASLARLGAPNSIGPISQANASILCNNIMALGTSCCVMHAEAAWHFTAGLQLLTGALIVFNAAESPKLIDEQPVLTRAPLFWQV